MHDPSPLSIVSNYTKQGGTSPGGRRWAVKWRCLSCPVCGRTFHRIVNPLRGRVVWCVGRDQLKVSPKTPKAEGGVL